MGGFFNYDNPVWRFIGKFMDLMILHALWLACSLPIVTAGASTTAVYYVTLKLVRDEEGYTIRSFFKSFRQNFRQATVIWLMLLLAGCVLGVDFYYFLKAPSLPSSLRSVFLAVLLVIAVVYLFLLLYVFPLQARFYNTVKRTMLNAFLMSIRHLPFTLAMLALDAALVAMAYLVPQLLVFCFLFGFPLVAFVNSYVLAYLFQGYMPKEAPHGGGLLEEGGEEDGRMDIREGTNEGQD